MDSRISYPVLPINKCNLHNQEYSWFCFDCLAFQCSACYDTHTTNGLIIDISLFKIFMASKKIYVLLSAIIYLQNLSKKKETIIHYWKQSNIILYNPITKAKTTYKLDQNINEYAESITFGKRIFIMGGMLIDSVFEPDIIKLQLKTRHPMNYKKYNHSLCVANGHVYSIGGSSGHIIRDCEKYSVFHDRWIQLPFLQISRKSCACFVFNNSAIYAFGGYSDDHSYLNSIEKLSLIEPSRWDLIETKDTPAGREYCMGYQVNEKQVLLFGGRNNTHYFKETYMLVIRENEVEFNQSENLASLSCFCSSSAPVLWKKVLYCADSDHHIHIYSPIARWSIIIEPQSLFME